MGSWSIITLVYSDYYRCIIKKYIIWKGENDLFPLSINNVDLTVYDGSLCENVLPETPKNW